MSAALKRDAWHTLAVWFSSVAAALLALATQVIVARRLDPHDYGAIVTGLAVFAITGTLGHFGLGNLLLRRHAEASATVSAWLRASLRFALLTSLLITVVVALFALVARDSFGELLLAMLPVGYSYTLSEIAIARLQLLERYRGVAATQLLPNLLRFLFGIAAVSLTNRPGLVAIALGIGSFLAAVAAYRQCRMKDANAEAESGVAITVADVLAQAWPYGLSMTIYLAYTQGGVVILQAVDSGAAAANFALALNILAAAYLLPFAVFQRVQAKRVNDWAAREPHKLLVYLKRAVVASGLTGVAVCVLLMFVASPAIELLFGAKYALAIPVLQVAALAIPFRFLATASGGTLNSHGDTRLRVFIQAFVLVVFAVLACQIGARASSLGVAKLLVVCEMAICCAYMATAWIRTRQRMLV